MLTVIERVKEWMEDLIRRATKYGYLVYTTEFIPDAQPDRYYDVLIVPWKSLTAMGFPVGGRVKVVYILPPDVRKVWRLVYRRDATGAENKITLYECEVTPGEKGRAKLVCREVAAYRLPGYLSLTREYVDTIAGVIKQSLELGEKDLSRTLWGILELANWHYRGRHQIKEQGEIVPA